MRNIESLNIPQGALRPSDYVNARVLAANVAESITVPQYGMVVLLSSDVDIYVNYTTTATVPAADVTDGTASEMNPSLRIISGVTTISVISPNDGRVTASFWRL